MITPPLRLAALSVLLWASCVTSNVMAQQRPNIVLLYIDDWAWNGSPVAMNDDMPNSRMPVLEMPNVERLAREGMKFQNAYACPQCSPARASVLTGQSAPRHGFTVYMNSRGQEYYDERSYQGFPVISCIANTVVNPDSLTIPTALAPLGYVSAHFGKWHLRGDPGDYGYAVHDGATTNNEGNTLRTEDGAVARLPDDLADPKLMFSVTERALGFIDEQVREGRPFYLQVSHYAMHEGRECLPATREGYVGDPDVQAVFTEANRTADTINRRQDPAVWLGMGEDLDGRIGAVLDRIEDLGIADKTFVILVADNGYRHGFLPGLPQPLHAHKWWLWEGGIRVPMIVRGPGIPAGTVFRGNVVNYDFLPTFVEWAGGDPGELQDIDGVSLARYMAGETPDESFLNRNLYFHYPHYRTAMPHSAVVAGDLKLLHFYERPDIPMLFDLSVDIGEVDNIAHDRSEEYRRLFDEMMSYLHSVGARIPKMNPDYDPETYMAQELHAIRVQWGPFEGRRSLDEDER